MTIEEYVTRNAWWWHSHLINRENDYSYIWYRVNEDGKPIRQMLDAFRHMHSKLDKAAKERVKAAGFQKEMVKQTILEFAASGLMKPMEKWEDKKIQEEPGLPFVPGAGPRLA